MARGDRPERTPVYGVLLIYAALFLFWLGSSIPIRGLSIALWAVGIATAAFGWLMTFRDYSF
ncbi:hypothetical protein GCM10009609_45160 [Pseudonocardia aurantiaca]